MRFPAQLEKTKIKKRSFSASVSTEWKKSYRTIKAEVDDDRPGVDVYTLQGYEERVNSYEAELRGINRDLLSIEDADDLEDSGTTLERLLSNLRICIKHLIRSEEEKLLPPTACGAMGISGIQLPKMRYQPLTVTS